MTSAPIKLHPNPASSPLARRLKNELQGDVLFDAYSRGRYSTDASIYQIEPVGVVIPKSEQDAQIALQIAREENVAVLPRGGGTSQCGQTVGAALIIDNSKYLNRILDFDKAARTVCVQPGVVLDHLNAWLKPHGLWYPVDVSTSAQATLGGMAGNNSCGSRSIRYGNMVHNVRAIDAVMADGAEYTFGATPADLSALDTPAGYRDLVQKVRAIAAREAAEIEARYPKVLRRVGGYNLDSVAATAFNMSHLLVGSEGTLAYSKRIHLNLSPLPAHKTLGICHFPTFYRSMEAPQHIVKLDPAAVELVDRTMIGLARDNPAFRPIVDQCVKGDPDAILLVEFAGEDKAEQIAKIQKHLGEGKSKDEVIATFVADYGSQSILSRPIDRGFNRLIWLAPYLIATAALAGVVLTARRWARQGAHAGLHIGDVADLLFKGGCRLANGHGAEKIGVENKTAHRIDGPPQLAQASGKDQAACSAPAEPSRRALSSLR